MPKPPLVYFATRCRAELIKLQAPALLAFESRVGARPRLAACRTSPQRAPFTPLPT